MNRTISAKTHITWCCTPVHVQKSLSKMADAREYLSPSSSERCNAVKRFQHACS